ncbi:MAG: OmpH family outer membrane protein [Flavobacteriales bacterium]|nr:OmpH family outer membrane protein [Flavobacteriales bacterium]
MRLTTFLFGALLLLGFQTQAQKFAYIDSDYVLSHMPEYADAQAELNRLSGQWQEEIEAKYEAIARLESAYKAEKILLTAETKKKREEEIASKKREAAELQKSKFGVDGELFSKREELIQPVQDKMFEAIQEVASQSGYMVIFDIKKNSNMLYSNPKYNVSDKVIKKMGYTPGEVIEKEENKQDSSSGKGSPGGKNIQSTNGAGGKQVRSGGKSTAGKK